MVSGTFLTLASGYQMPQVGFGLWKVPRESAAETLQSSLVTIPLTERMTIRTNKTLARALEGRSLTALSLAKRFSSLPSCGTIITEGEHVLKMANRQSDTLGPGYIDLYLIHFPIALKFIEPSELEFPAWWVDSARSAMALDKVLMAETWAAMEAVVDIGIARSIRASNFSAPLIYDIMTYARYPISSLQIEHHPYLVQPELVKLAQENDIAVTAYSSFGPQSFLELPPDFSDKAKAVRALNERIISLVAKYGQTPAQILLRNKRPKLSTWRPHLIATWILGLHGLSTAARQYIYVVGQNCSKGWTLAGKSLSTAWEAAWERKELEQCNLLSEIPLQTYLEG
ncbi:NADP-dependent oxidoreductase domain-containing protein [Lipomyces kononenkoae]|uniref:NADP-dependent oxidoreductase domain-containing protein n=1 Tax=Lipomyces kononenkoae TaxID=34357 RepID=A0ACC3STS4_LIPKO